MRQRDDLTQNIRASKKEIYQAELKITKRKEKSKVLTALKRAQDQNILKGIAGRLGDLGVIDKKYDTAVTTACKALDHIVCYSYEDA